MLDTFLFTHPPLVFKPGHEEWKSTFFSIEVSLLCHCKLGGYWDEALNETRNARLFRIVFELALEEIIQKLRPLNFLERSILEVIALHRMRLGLIATHEVREHKRRGTCILGTMIQHRLTTILSGIRLSDARRIYDLQHDPSLDNAEWRSSFIGAAAVAKTIRAGRLIPDAELFLPTIQEDVDHGIDLFIKQDNTLLALGVKVGPHDTKTWAKVPTKEDGLYPGDSKYAETCANILRGIEELPIDLSTLMTPVILYAGRDNDHPYDIIALEEDAEPLKDIFDRLREQKRGPPQEPTSHQTSTQVA